MCMRSLTKHLRVLTLLAGVLLTAQPQDARAYPQMDVSTDSLAAHIRILEAAGGPRSRVTFTPGNDTAAVLIKNWFESIPGLTSVAFDTFFVAAQPPYDAKPQMNVVATLESSRPGAALFVLGAHYDCSASRMGTTIWNQQWATIQAPGADDNATGIASLLEIARILSDPEFGFDRNLTVKFVAFASEESGPAHSGGHGGSRHFAQAAKARGENLIGMISVDMIGFNRNYYYTAIVSDSASIWLGTAFRRALDSTAVDLQTNSRPYPTATYSDHETFWAEGYPAILLIENAPPWTSTPLYNANPYYHTSWDSLGTVNLELVKRVTQGVLAMTVAMSGGVTAIEEEAPAHPVAFDLHQNFPNPFNPSTVIRYQLPAAADVRLAVYDLLGREVALLVDDQKVPGRYEVRFDARELSSGVYIYRLTAGPSVQTRRMVLVR